MSNLGMIKINYQVHLLGMIDNVCFKTYNSKILMVLMRVFEPHSVEVGLLNFHCGVGMV